MKIDKLSVTFDLMTSEDYQNTLKMVLPEIKLWLPKYSPYVIPPKKESYYHHGVRFTMPEGGTVFLQCGPKKHSSKFMRLEWNPSEIGVSGHHHLRELLKPFYACPPKNYFDHVLMHGNVTRLDLCVDLWGKAVRDLVIGGYPKRKR